MSQPKISWLSGFLMYGLALLLVPVLGVLATAVVAWHALLAGSIWYLLAGGLLVMIVALVLIHAVRRSDH